MYTVITKGNEVRVYDPDYAVLAISDIGDCIVITDSGEIIVNQGNPITWPTDATSGMQAIVDVKAGTLRFAYDGWPRAHTEFVVSEYVEPVTIGVKPFVESVHILDHIDNWPNPVHTAVLQGEIFDDWRWWQDQGGGSWILRNDKENTEFNEGHWLNYHENKKKYAEPVQIGTKHDHGKPILGAVPPHAELAVGRVLTFGAEKYARGNWDKVEDHENRYMDAALRHLNAHRRGELADSESGESHLAHAACCILFMLDKQERSC